MSLQKYFCFLSQKYSNLTSLAFHNKHHFRTYTFLTAERKEFRRLCSSLGIKVSNSAGNHLSAAKNEDKLNNPSIPPQPIQFDDLSFDKHVSHEDLIIALHKCKTVSEQMEMLASTLSLRQDDIRNRIQFCKTLETLFKPFFNDFKIQIFGSTFNGLGFKGCDIDMSFETSAEYIEKEVDAQEEDVPLVSEVISGKVTPQNISQLYPKNQLQFVLNVLLEYYRESEAAPLFIDAHVPLVRFHHDKFGLKCDLTCKNNVAFANTKLLYLFHKLDKRVAPFVMTIRYWAKHHEIIGKGLMFNSYTISLLAIFFLQTRTPPILPSVESILAMSDSLGIEDMNDESFLSLLEKIPPSKNEQSLEELLREFFFFCSFFDTSRVICPLTATAVPKEDFLSRPENSRFKNNTICIQDPMYLKHNVADLVKYEFCKKLIDTMLLNCHIFLKEDILKPSSGPWGLISLLDVPKNYLSKFRWSKVVSSSVPLLSKAVNGEISKSERISASADTLVKILEYAFLFTYNRLETNEYQNLIKKQDKLIEKHEKKNEDSVKTKILHLRVRQSLFKQESDASITFNQWKRSESMLEQFQKFNGENELLFCAKCTISKNVWDDRHLVKLDSMPEPINILEKERLISLQTAEENKKTRAIKAYSFLCECWDPKDGSETLILNFRPYENKYFSPIVGVFLEENILRILKDQK